MQFGEKFSNAVKNILPGEQILVNLLLDGIEQKCTVSATRIVVANKQETLISMQNIESELDRVQIQAWQDLVGILTHEIMNSITPITSLANTAVDLVKDATQKLDNKKEFERELQEKLDDVTNAVQTVAKRGQGLTQFIGSYKRLTHLPPLNREKIKIHELFGQVVPLASESYKERGISLQTRIQPSELELSVDVNMLEQSLINLMKNSEQALKDTSSPKIDLSALLNPAGRIVISVSDNGGGVPENVVDEIFVPFFTTKKSGSGVGLALTRQIMLAHGGSVKLMRNGMDGAQFSLIF